MLALLGTGSVLAQTATAPPPAPAEAPADPLAKATLDIAKMRAIAETVRHQLGEARRARDVVKVLCLDDKLSQADVAVRSAEDRRTALENALARNDSEAAGHESVMLGVLAQRSQQVAGGAAQCIGEETSFSAAEQSTVKVDPGISQGEQPGYPPANLGDLAQLGEPPQCTTCTR